MTADLDAPPRRTREAGGAELPLPTGESARRGGPRATSAAACGAMLLAVVPAGAARAVPAAAPRGSARSPQTEWPDACRRSAARWCGSASRPPSPCAASPADGFAPARLRGSWDLGDLGLDVRGRPVLVLWPAAQRRYDHRTPFSIYDVTADRRRRIVAPRTRRRCVVRELAIWGRAHLAEACWTPVSGGYRPFGRVRLRACGRTRFSSRGARSAIRYSNRLGDAALPNASPADGRGLER